MFEPTTPQYRRAVIRPNDAFALSSTEALPSSSSIEHPTLPAPFDALPPFAQQIAAEYSPRQAVLALARHLAIGGRECRPTLPLAPKEWPAITVAELLMLATGNPYRMELKREHPSYEFSLPRLCAVQAILPVLHIPGGI